MRLDGTGSDYSHHLGSGHANGLGCGNERPGTNLDGPPGSGAEVVFFVTFLTLSLATPGRARAARGPAILELLVFRCPAGQASTSTDDGDVRMILTVDKMLIFG